jgi:hypothetical protein
MNVKVIALLTIVFLIFSSKAVTEGMMGFMPPNFVEHDVLVLLIKTCIFAVLVTGVLFFYKIDRNVIRVPYTQVKVNPNPNQTIENDETE